MLSKNRIKFIKSLQLKKNRDEFRLFTVEGEKIVLELAGCKAELVENIYVTSQFPIDQLIEYKINYEIISDNDLRQISGLKNPNNAFAICKQWINSTDQYQFALVLDGIQDPGNLGTLIRLADWYGVKNIICSLDTVDCFNPKVVQATMGSLFRVDLMYTDLEIFLKENKLPVFGALLSGENVYKMELKPEGILILGNEGNGISSSVLPFINRPLTIPKVGNAESLNVSIAGAILLSEFFRANLN